MKKRPQSFLVGFVLGLICLLPLHAQTAGSARADANSTTASQMPTGQAPDEATKKITELVHAGQYTEAQKLTAGLLVAYPDDQRLIKAKALIDKLLSPAGQPTIGSSQPAANANAEQLTGMDKVDYDAIIELGRQAQQSTDLEQQNTLLRSFLTNSMAFLQKHPDQMLLWQLRAQASISLNDPMAGYEAGQKLLAAGVTDSTDSNIRRLLAQLKNKGWLDKEAAMNEKKLQIYILETINIHGADDVESEKEFFGELRNKMAPDVISLLQSLFPHTNVRTEPLNVGPDPILKVNINLQYEPYTFSSCQLGVWKGTCHLKPGFTVSVHSATGLQVDRTFTLPIVVHFDCTGSGWLGKFYLQLRDLTAISVLEKLKGVLNEEAVRTSVTNPVPSGE